MGSSLGFLRNSSKGFSLIEALVALSILSVALLGSASLLTSLTNYNLSANHVTRATDLAQEKLEHLKNTATLTDTDAVDTQSVYKRRWIVTTNSPAAGLTTISVRVNWNWRGRTRSVVLDTMESQ